jgi:hypothetical protein
MHVLREERPLVSESLGRFLRARKTSANEDLVDRWRIGLETQVNVAQGNGEPVADKRSTFTDGITTWHAIRIPKDANSEPWWDDYRIGYPLSEHAEGIGMTGWDWQTRMSRWCGFDFDELTTHAKSTGIDAAQLETIQQAACALPYVEVRRSTGGKGLHLYVYFDDEGIPTKNHTEHAGLAECLLGMMSAECNFDFAGPIDRCGGAMWVWHRKMTAENSGLKIIKPAAKRLSVADLPADWRDQIKTTKKRESGAGSTAKPIHPVDDDFCRTADFSFLLDHDWKRNEDYFVRPGTDKPVSASIVTAKDGTRLLHVFSSNAQPLEAERNYNAFDAYTVLNHNGDAEAARAALVKQGYGRLRVALLSCADLDDNTYDLEYLIEDTLVKGQPCIVAGHKKSLKTSLLIDEAVSLATGEPFLGRMKVARPCSVIVLSGESGMATLQETARRICRSKGVALAEIENLHWSDFLPAFNEVQHRDALERMIEEMKCEVLIVDPAYFCMPGADAANLFIQGSLLRQVSDICQRHGVGLILSHHTRKRGKTRNHSDHEPPELDDIAWAGFAEFARQWLLVGRREDYVPGSGQHKLWLNTGGSAGHSALWAVDVEEGVSGMPRHWKVMLSTPHDARVEKKARSIRQRLCDAASQFPKGQTKTAILETAKLKSNEATRHVFDAMVGEQSLIACQVPKNGTEYPGYRLSPDAIRGLNMPA